MKLVAEKASFSPQFENVIGICFAATAAILKSPSTIRRKPVSI
jgi:hypothetical protein